MWYVGQMSKTSKGRQCLAYKVFLEEGGRFVSTLKKLEEDGLFQEIIAKQDLSKNTFYDIKD